MQTLMNVGEVPICVLITAPTLMEATYALADWDTVYQAMVAGAMVSSRVWSRSKNNPCFSTDIDECREDTDNCAQQCSNTVGSYVCSCSAGYRLASNGYSCNGMIVSD